MKAFLLGAVALAVVAVGPASAADMPLKAAPPVVAPVKSWQGFYMGGSLGGAWQDPDNWAFSDGIRTATLGNESSWVGGLHTGYNWQWNWLVLGTETNYRFTDLNSSGTCGAFTCNQRTQNIFTFGGRAGVAFNDWLLYGTGGFARTSVETTTTAAAGIVNDSTSHWHNGWFGGGGVEYAFTPSIVVGVQYTHVNVDDRFDTAFPANVNNNRNVGGGIDMVEARVSFKLWEGLWGPFSK